MISRFDSKCSFAGCTKDGKIRKGENITWNRSMRGVAYHVECFEAMSANGAIQAEVTAQTETAALKQTPATTESSVFGVFADALAPFLEAKLASKVDEHAVEQLVSEKVAEAMRPVHKTIHLEVVSANGTHTVVDPHPAFETVLMLAGIRQSAYLFGPAGTGKTTIGSQVATALGLDFRQISLTAQSFPSLLSGYMDANGRYVGTDFRRVYENGGVFLIDEMDAASGNLLTWLNSALANGHASSFPDGMVSRHADFVCIATGNTRGKGSTDTYAGRSVLDAATLDRFAFVEVGYDEASERKWALAMDPGAGDWVTYVQRVRKAAAENKLRHLVTPRATLDGIRAMKAGMAREAAIQVFVRRGLEQDAWGKIA